MRQKIVVLTGAGISAESGLNTFRDSDGLWEGYNINDVATPEAWARNPELVQGFYNMRRKSILEADPNRAHRALVLLEKMFDVTIVTQNIDDLHERAGSTNIIHLHGIITKSQSDRNPDLLYDIDGWEVKTGELCELGSQLRPHVVWFGEPVPMIEKAADICAQADIFLIIGTSLAVYPAAGLVDYVPSRALKYLLDPKGLELTPGRNNAFTIINERASLAVPELVQKLLSDAEDFRGSKS